MWTYYARRFVVLTCNMLAVGQYYVFVRHVFSGMYVDHMLIT